MLYPRPEIFSIDSLFIFCLNDLIKSLIAFFDVANSYTFDSIDSYVVGAGWFVINNSKRALSFFDKEIIVFSLTNSLV